MITDTTPKPPETPAGELDSAGCAPMLGSGRPLLATRDGTGIVFGLLLASGGMCPDCSYGTRKTSKNWAVCKKCGNRVPRCEMSEVKVTTDRQNVDMEATRGLKKDHE